MSLISRTGTTGMDRWSAACVGAPASLLNNGTLLPHTTRVLRFRPSRCRSWRCCGIEARGRMPGWDDQSFGGPGVLGAQVRSPTIPALGRGCFCAVIPVDGGRCRRSETDSARATLQLPATREVLGSRRSSLPVSFSERDVAEVYPSPTSSTHDVPRS
jgi:hypothetical protein